MENWTIFLLILIGGVLFFVIKNVVLDLARQNSMKNEYQNLAEPRLLLQCGETDTEFWARVQRERERFLGSGNKWAQKQTPVIAIPYDCEFEVAWFGKSYDFSTIGMGQREYNRQAMFIYDKLYAMWQKEVFGKFGQDAAFEAMGQDPFDAKKIWEPNN